MAKGRGAGAIDPVTAAGGAEPRRQRGRGVIVATLVAGVFLVWFALANLHRVRIDFWIYDKSEPLILVILIAGLLGGVIGALLMRRHVGHGPEQ